MEKTMKKTDSILDEAFREYDLVAAGEDETYEPEGEATSFEDEDEDGEFSLSIDEEGEGEPGEGEDGEGEIGEPAPEELENSEDGEEFEGDEPGEFGYEAEGEPEASEDTPVVASIEEIEADIIALQRSHRLHEIPKGITASAKIDFMLNSGAIWELKPITASDSEEIESALDDVVDSENGEFAPEGDAPEFEDEDAGEGAGESEAEGTEEPAASEGEVEGEEEPVAFDDSAFEPDVEEPAASECETPAVATASAIPEANMHPVADAGLLAMASADDVQLVLSETEDPVWNVLVSGVPAARIALSSVPNGQHVRAGFLNQNFGHNLIGIMRKNGVVEALVEAKAEFYANSFKTSELAQEIRASVADELSADHVTRTINLRESLLDHSRLVVAGMAKGYFAKVSNPLFTKAREVLAARGVVDAEAAALEIVSASSDMFAVATEKAVELMDRDPQFIEQLRENIEDTQTRVAAADAGFSAPSPVSAFASRLANQALASAAPVDAPATVATQPARSNLANLVGRLSPVARR
jgi:hypothetical protein